MYPALRNDFGVTDINIYNSKILRFGDVATAIGATPKSLRLWLQRGLVELEVEKGEGWQAYSFLDLSKLALVKAAVHNGVEVKRAFDFATFVIGVVLVRFRGYKDTPAAEILAAFKDQNCAYDSVDKNGCGYVFRDGPLEERLPAVFLMIYAERLLFDVFGKAAELIEDAELSDYCEKNHPRNRGSK